MDINSTDESKDTQLQLRMKESVKSDLKVLATLKGLSMSATILSLITKAVSDARREFPEKYGLTSIPPHRSRFDVYAEAFESDLSESEWQLLETHFKERVNEYKRFRREIEDLGKSEGKNEQT